MARCVGYIISFSLPLEAFGVAGVIVTFLTEEERALIFQTRFTNLDDLRLGLGCLGSLSLFQAALDLGAGRMSKEAEREFG